MNDDDIVSYLDYWYVVLLSTIEHSVVPLVKTKITYIQGESIGLKMSVKFKSLMMDMQYAWSSKHSHYIFLWLAEI